MSVAIGSGAGAGAGLDCAAGAGAGDGVCSFGFELQPAAAIVNPRAASCSRARMGFIRRSREGICQCTSRLLCKPGTLLRSSRRQAHQDAEAAERLPFSILLAGDVPGNSCVYADEQGTALTAGADSITSAGLERQP
jgi:hypothetical protein